jgi:hypothetical protein
MTVSDCLEKTFLNHFLYLKGPPHQIEIGLGFEYSKGTEAVRARHVFSLAWLVSEENLSEGGLALLIGSGFKKGCVYYTL